ncbi:MAG: metallophosphoesterase [Planococcaceae bacterium]|nr:metallophosphoesterase [Planococcaceae bacterium]
MIFKLIKYVSILLSIVVFIYINNNWITTTNHKVSSPNIPAAFDGYRIVQVSDLHDATFGENQQRLVKKVKQAKPDLIVITGDLVDSRRYDLPNSLDLVNQLVKLADVYYVTGNHEVATNDVEFIKRELKALGVHVLSNETLMLEHGNDSIAISGIEDPLMGQTASEMLNEAEIRSDVFTLLLAHRPEDFQTYKEFEIDLTFSGHAHGGQFRIPFVGGLIAPGQGFFPKFTAGIHEKEQSKLVISRGLGNSILPFRLFNLPEIVVVTLQSS